MRADCLPYSIASATTSPYQFNRVIRVKWAAAGATTAAPPQWLNLTWTLRGYLMKFAKSSQNWNSSCPKASTYSQFFRLCRYLLRASCLRVALLGWSSPPLQAFANPSTDKSDSFQLPAQFSMLRFFYFLQNVCPF